MTIIHYKFIILGLAMRILLYLIVVNIFFTACGSTSSTPKSEEDFEYSPIDIDNMQVEKAVIVRIVDGDTFMVRYFNDKKDTRIRFLGLQAMEIHPKSYGVRNDCWADDAKKRLIELTGGVGNMVILLSKDTSTKILDRYARHVFTQVSGKTVNVAKTLIKEGLAFPFPHRTEDTFNKEYTKLAKKSKSAGLGLWSNDNHCPTPADSCGSSFELSVNYDAKGNDYKNLNGEWVTIKNTASASVDLSHWWLRDSALNFFRFPSGTILPSGEKIIVYGGEGENNASEFYWGNKTPIFDNFGDSVYLVDYLDGDDIENQENAISPKGNIKGSSLY